MGKVPGAKSGGGERQLSPRRLALALMGELFRDAVRGPYRAVDLVSVLQSAGVSAPAARAALDRFVVRGLLLRSKVRRGIHYELTPAGEDVLRNGAARVHAQAPFAPNGEGWTLVTFSVPEGDRGVRQKLRAALTWAGFALLRDGVWIAAGDRDPSRAFEALGSDFQAAEIVAFRARDLPAFSMRERVDGAWDLDAIRDAHLGFIERWGSVGECEPQETPLATRTLLVADWMALLRKDPSLPAELLGDEWPAALSHETYLTCREQYEEAAVREGAELLSRSELA